MNGAKLVSLDAGGEARASVYMIDVSVIITIASLSSRGECVTTRLNVYKKKEREREGGGA